MGGEAEEKETYGFSENRKSKEEEEEDSNSEKMLEEECGGVQIPLHRWLMHGAVMFGREFCYAMETALVAPVVLQIGLPEQYYSLTWFLSPVLGLLLTPIIGSASDRCSLRWGRRRPFILALCVGVLLGIALFLNGSLIGLSIGDRPNNQPIGIVLTVVGVIVLDFCADATDGPIRAYLLDVADTEEQDMALNIHAVSAGLGGAVGYMLGGLDWTGTALGKAFKSQEQVLFLFAGIIFIVSVILHMFSIPEQPLTPSSLLKDTGGGESKPQVSFSQVGQSSSGLEVIAEEGCSFQGPSGETNRSDREKGVMDFLSVDRVRSKSDSILAMPDATIEFDPDLDPDRQIFLPETNFLPETEAELQNAFMPSDHNTSLSHSDEKMVLKPLIQVVSTFKCQTNGCPSLQSRCGSRDSHHRKEDSSICAGLNSYDLLGASNSRALAKLRNRTSSASSSSAPRAQTFYRQPSFTLSYFGRVGLQRSQLRRPPFSGQPITVSCSLNDLSKVQHHADRRELHLSAGSLSSKSSSSEGEAESGTTVQLLWQSMFKMPTQLWRLCVCHLLTWFAYIAESVFYTDFMGQVIYNGDPKAETNSTELQNYHRGVQMGCWGLVVYAATAALCSALLQKYLDNFDLSIKVVYIVGTLAFSVGTAVMAIFPNVYVAMVMISTMGIISMSISYCPYALLGQYHEIKEFINHSPENTKRGFGIDCAILSCQVYVSQILVAAALGSVIEAVGSVRVVPAVASAGSFLGFVTACFLVIYPDMEPSSSKENQDLLEEEELHGGKTDGQRPSLLKLTGTNGSKDMENYSLHVQ